MKKVISFVLVLALVLGSFSMAFAAPATTGLSDISDSANQEAIQVVNDLGIVTGYDVREEEQPSEREKATLDLRQSFWGLSCDPHCHHPVFQGGREQGGH